MPRKYIVSQFLILAKLSVSGDGLLVGVCVWRLRHLSDGGKKSTGIVHCGEIRTTGTAMAVTTVLFWLACDFFEHQVQDGGERFEILVILHWPVGLLSIWNGHVTETIIVEPAFQHIGRGRHHCLVVWDNAPLVSVEHGVAKNVQRNHANVFQRKRSNGMKVNDCVGNRKAGR